MGGSGKGGVKVGEGQDQDVPEQKYLVHLEAERKRCDMIIELFACNCLYSWSIVMQKQLSRAIKMLRVNCKVLACNIL